MYYSKKELSFDDSVESINDLPDVFVYLMDDGEPICFRRDSITEYLDPSFLTKWLEFEPDRAVGKIYKNYKSGFFSMKLYICVSGGGGEFASDQDECPAYHDIRPPIYEKFRVRVCIY